MSTRRRSAYDHPERKKPRTNNEKPNEDQRLGHEKFSNTRDNVFKSIYELSKKFRKIYANELFICIFELVQYKEFPMIALENLTDNEKEVIQLYLVKAIHNLRTISYTQIEDDYSREITSGVTIFRIELFPQLMKLVKSSKKCIDRLIEVLLDFYRTSKCRVYISTYQGDTLDSVGKKERRLHLLSTNDRSNDGPAVECDSCLERPKTMPPYPYRPHPEGHFWWQPNIEEWGNDQFLLNNEHAKSD